MLTLTLFRNARAYGFRLHLDGVIVAHSIEIVRNVQCSTWSDALQGADNRARMIGLKIDHTRTTSVEE